MYQRSIDDPEGFWGEHKKRIDWFTPYRKKFEDGKTNAELQSIVIFPAGRTKR